MTTITMKVYAYLDAAWTDITADVSNTGISASWGFDSNSPFNMLASTGSMSFSMNNVDGLYIPGGSSVISDDWKKGCKIKVVFTYDGVDYIRFYGVIDQMNISAGLNGDRKVSVTVLDWMDYAAKYPMNNPAIQENITADEALTTIVNAMPIAPLGTSFDVGENVFPFVFSDTTLKTFAYSEFQKLASSELGWIYLRKDPSSGEVLVFKNASGFPQNQAVKQVALSLGTSALLLETGDYLLQENGDRILLGGYSLQDVSVDNTMLDMQVSYGNNLINRVYTNVYPASADITTTLLYDLINPLYIPSGESTVFNIQFQEQSSKRIVTALPPDDTYPTTLIHFDDSTSENPIVEESGKSWGFQGGATLINSPAKFGSRALYLDGGANTYADGESSDDYNLGNGDFTIEWWEYRFNADAGEAVLNRDIDTYTTYPPFLLGYSNGSNSLIYFSSNGSSFDIANGKSFGSISTNTWVHYAVTRYGSTWMAFKNGTLTDSWTSSATILSTNGAICIGKYGSAYVTAVIDELRIIKGQAKYTSNFTVPDEPYTLSGTFYNAYTQSNRGGTELTGDFDISINYGAAGAEVTVTNNSALDGYLTALKIYSYMVDTSAAITDIQENSISYNQYGYHTQNLNQVYKSDLTEGALFAAKVIGENSEPYSKVESITINANRDEAHAKYFLNTDIGDVVDIVESQTEIDSSFRIMGMGWSATPSAVAPNAVNVNYSWKVKEVRKALTNSAIDTSYVGSSLFPNINFGYLENTNINNRLWSAWVKVKNFGFLTSQIATIFNARPSGTGGYFIDFTVNDSGEYYLTLQSNYYSGAGVWTSVVSSGGAFDTWYHVAVRYNRSSFSNVPSLYINGSPASLTSSIQPSGSVYGETNISLKIGGLSGVLEQGTVKDLRIYDASQISTGYDSFVASLYAAGAYDTGNTTGLLFNALGVTLSDYNTYLDSTLPSNVFVYDKINRFAGTPNGSPTLRAA